jgi:hypothetical protein
MYVSILLNDVSTELRDLMKHVDVMSLQLHPSPIFYGCNNNRLKTTWQKGKRQWGKQKYRHKCRVLCSKHGYDCQYSERKKYMARVVLKI